MLRLFWLGARPTNCERLGSGLGLTFDYIRASLQRGHLCSGDCHARAVSEQERGQRPQSRRALGQQTEELAGFLETQIVEIHLVNRDANSIAATWILAK